MLDLESWASGSISTRGNILSLDFFCFPVVKPLMAILALLPMLCICENLDWQYSFGIARGLRLEARYLLHEKSKQLPWAPRPQQTICFSIAEIFVENMAKYRFNIPFEWVGAFFPYWKAWISYCKQVY